MILSSITRNGWTYTCRENPGVKVTENCSFIDPKLVACHGIKVASLENLSLFICKQQMRRSGCSNDLRHCVHFVDSITSLSSKSKMSKLLIVFKGEQSRLCPTWSETSKTGFLEQKVHLITVNVLSNIKSLYVQYYLSLAMKKTFFQCFRPSSIQTSLLNHILSLFNQKA